jgi:hypothetical protein
MNLLNIKGKIAVFEANLDERANIHEWLRQQTPKIYSAGVFLEKFPCETHVYVECNYCNNKKVLLDKYNYGVLDNNKDEYRSGECQECGEHVYYECNYDGGARYVSIRNAICVGAYFKSWDKSRSFVENYDNTDEIHSILNEKNIYFVDDPKHSINSCNMGKYIDNCIS